MNREHESNPAPEKGATTPIESWARESVKAARLAQIEHDALDMMEGDDEAAFTWLHTPLGVLNNETPLEHANTELGARHVEDLISRRRQGVFY